MRCNYNGPVIVPKDILDLGLPKLQTLVLSAVFSGSDLGGIYGSDRALAAFLGASTRQVNVAKNSLAKLGLITITGPVLTFNFDAFTDPDALRAVLVDTASARSIKPVLAKERA